MNKKEKLLKIFSNNKLFHFSLDYYGLLLCAVVCIIYFVRKSISKIIDFKKKSRTYTVNTSNQNNPRNYNVALYNPELQTIGMTYLGMVVSCVITSSGIYVWYFSKDKSPMWSEFEYFLMDFTIHIATTVVIPFVLYCKNPKLRKYVFSLYSDMFSFK